MSEAKNGAALTGTSSTAGSKSAFLGKRIEDTDTGDIGTIVDETESAVGVQWPDMPNAIDYRMKASLEKA